MRHELSNGVNPVDASMDAVLPGVNDRLTAIQNSVDKSKASLEYKIDQMEAATKATLLQQSKQTKLELAKEFAAVALHLASEVGVGGRNNVRADESQETRMEEEEDEALISNEELFRRVEGAQIIFPSTARVRSIRVIFYEYYGLEMFKGRPIDGGIETCEMLWRNKWRKNYKGAESKLFSRSKLIVNSIWRMIFHQVENEEGDADEVRELILDTMEEKYAELGYKITPMSKWIMLHDGSIASPNLGATTV
jgi:hypothetical protein